MTTTHEDFHAIVNVAIAYTLALDTKNFDALNDVFAPDATGMLNGVHCDSRDAIIARISGSLLRLDFTQHLVGNHQVNVTGDTATHRCQLHAQHVKTGTEGGDNFIIGGYYDDVFARTAGGWRIKHRIMQPTWRSDNANVVKK
jgi:ketosteroid isomerase-like protein